MAPTQFDDEQEPKPGDLIQVFRLGYQHWAVYIGDGYVVHLTSDPRNSGCDLAMCITAEKAIVKMERLQDVLGNSNWKINNILDEEYEPRPAHVVVMEARRLVDSVKPYCVLWKNCEHFATELRYGKPESRQVTRARDLGIYGGISVCIGVVLIALIKLLRLIRVYYA